MTLAKKPGALAPSKPRPKAEPAKPQRGAHSRNPEDLFHAHVGAVVRKARKVREWTQVELAARAGLSSNHLACLERGEVGLSLWVAHRLARALGTSLDALLADAPVAPPLARTKFAKSRFAL